MKTLKMAALALVGMMAAASPSWSQCYVGLGAGGSIANMGLDVPGSGGFGVDGLGQRSSRPDLKGTVGCDIGLAGPVFIGAFGSMTYQDVAFNVQPGLLSASLGNSWDLGLRTGYRFESGSKAFVKAAWTNTDLDLGGLLVAGGIPPGIDIPSKLQGWKLGGGMETPLKGTPLVIGTEIDWIRYNKESIAGGLVDLKTDQLQGMVTLKYVFGGSFAPAVLK